MPRAKQNAKKRPVHRFPQAKRDAKKKRLVHEETGPLFAKKNTPAGMGAHPLEPVPRQGYQFP